MTHPLFLSYPETCRLLGVGTTTLRSFTEDGTLHPVHIKSRALFVAAEVFEFSSTLAREAGVSVDPVSALRTVDNAPTTGPGLIPAGSVS